MKFNSKSIVGRGVLGAVALLVVAASAQASDGVVNFTGAVTDTTCTVTVTPGTGRTGNVPLPDIAATALATDGAWGMRTPFQIKLTGCTVATSTMPTKVAAYFEPTATVDLTNGLLKNTSVGAGSATKVEIALLSGDNSVGSGTTSAFDPITVGGLTPNSPQVNLTAGAADLNYFAQYQAVGGAATVGAVTAQVTYTLAYN